MADAVRRLATQRARESNHLTYGHFGTCTYDEKRKDWTFLRQYVQPSQKEFPEDNHVQHGNPQLTFDLLRGPEQVLSRVLPTTPKLEPTGTLNANAFLKFLPESATGLAEYKNTLRSENSNDMATEDEGDPPRGDLLVFGQASALKCGRADRTPPNVPILAHVLRQDEVKLRISSLSQNSLRDPRSTSGNIVELPRISMDDVGIWTSAHGPIQQVISSRKAAGRVQTVLGIRSSSATTLLMPLLRSTAFARYSSVLHPSIVVTIPCQFTGGASHADIAFQHQKTDEIAIVDAAGNWSLWKLEERRSSMARAQHRARLLSSRSLYADYQSSKTSKVLKYPDGWHRICWLATSSDSPDRILVCNRYFACVYDIHGKLKGEVNMRMNAQNIRDSILDVKPVVSSANECFILTTSSLLWMSTNHYGSSRSIDESGLYLLGSWNHFRAHNNVELRMHLLDHSTGTFVLLSMSASPILTIYHASRSARYSSPTCFLSDPVPITLLPTTLSYTTEQKVEALRWVESTSSVASGERLLFKILLSDPVGNISEAIYQVQNHDSRESEIKPLEIVRLPPKDRRIFRSERYVDSDDSDDFAFDDDSSERHAELHASVEEDIETLPEDNKVSLDAIELQVSGVKITFQQFLQQIEKVSSSIKSLHLLSELFPERPYIDELEENSDQLSSLLKKFSIKDIKPTEEDSSPPIPSPELIVFDSRSLIQIYESLLQTKLTPLPPTTAIRDRISRERQCRQEALEIFLSNHAVHPKIWINPNPSRRDAADLHLTTQDEASDSDLSDRARRKKERKAKIKEARLESQRLRKKAVLEAATSVPVIMSSQIPIRAAKSSQGGMVMSSQGPGGGSSVGGGSEFNMPGITLTQPERGAHGSRNMKKGKKKKSVKIPGFN